MREGGFIKTWNITALTKSPFATSDYVLIKGLQEKVVFLNKYMVNTAEIRLL